MTSTVLLIIDLLLYLLFHLLIALKVISEYPTELDGISLNNKSPPKTETVSDTPKSEVHNSDPKSELIADNGQYYVEGETVERQSQYLISTMASQNKVRLVRLWITFYNYEFLYLPVHKYLFTSNRFHTSMK